MSTRPPGRLISQPRSTPHNSPLSDCKPDTTFLPHTRYVVTAMFNPKFGTGSTIHHNRLAPPVNNESGRTPELAVGTSFLPGAPRLKLVDFGSDELLCWPDHNVIDLNVLGCRQAPQHRLHAHRSQQMC